MSKHRNTEKVFEWGRVDCFCLASSFLRLGRVRGRRGDMLCAPWDYWISAIFVISYEEDDHYIVTNFV